MPTLFGKKITQQELVRRIGHLSQVGGVDLISRDNGRGRGVRWLEFQTGTGFIFRVSLDRGMDVGPCEYRGCSLAWIPPTDFASPWLFDQTDDFGWLRTALGGLINTCGLVHVGNPEKANVGHYRFPAIEQEKFGVHDRAALTPARLIYSGERWDGDVCYLEATGEINQARVYGENLSLKRNYRAILGESRFTIHDTVKNQGHLPTNHKLLYHINIGYPFVDEGSELLAPFFFSQSEMLVSGKPPGSEAATRFIAPQDDWQFEVFRHTMLPDRNGSVEVAIINPNLELGLYLIYQQHQFPVFLQTCLMAPGTYMVSLEPSTTELGQNRMASDGSLEYIQPGQTRQYSIEMGVLENTQQITAFSERIKTVIRTQD